MPKKFWIAAGIFLLLAVLHLAIYNSLPDADKNGVWPSTVMRNWHESGFWKLSGQLVANPGGVDPGEPLFIYPGHRPYLVYPAYVLKELPGAWGGNGMLFDFVMTLVSFCGIVYLFGSNSRGWTIAFVTCFAPGFILNVARVDTISYPAVTAFAALTFVGGFLTRDENRCRPKALALVVLLLFMVMNWSTLFSLFVMLVYVICKRPPEKKTLLFAGSALAVGLVVFAFSILSRHSGGASSNTFWNAYLMGPKGYDGQGMNWSKALVRITGVNIISWLPLMLAALVLLVCNGPGDRWRRAPLPLLAGILAVFSMRNYNAHHPWGATCIIGLGLLFALELALAPAPKPDVKPVWVSGGLTAATAIALGYALCWSALNEFNHREENGIWDLLARNTPRHCLIVIEDNFVPAEPLNVSRMADQFDRKVIAESEWNQNRAKYAVPGRECFLLTHETLPAGQTTLVAESISRPRWADKIMVPMFDFYRSKISRRSAGDRIVLSKQTLLYKL